jgi:hypothetical protein
MTNFNDIKTLLGFSLDTANAVADNLTFFSKQPSLILVP